MWVCLCERRDRPQRKTTPSARARRRRESLEVCSEPLTSEVGHFDGSRIRDVRDRRSRVVHRGEAAERTPAPVVAFSGFEITYVIDDRTTSGRRARFRSVTRRAVSGYPRPLERPTADPAPCPRGAPANLPRTAVDGRRSRARRKTPRTPPQKRKFKLAENNAKNMPTSMLGPCRVRAIDVKIRDRAPVCGFCVARDQCLRVRVLRAPSAHSNSLSLRLTVLLFSGLAAAASAACLAFSASAFFFFLPMRSRSERSFCF